jgi:hypothetical protein
VRRSTLEPLTELTLAIFPDGESQTTLIEDDGETMAYEQGDLAETPVHVSHDADGGRTTVRLDARRGPFQPHPRTLTLQIHVAERPAQVLVDGNVHDEWAWDDARHTATLSWPDDGEAHDIALETPD